MEILNIAIMDDNKSKIDTIDILFMQQSDETSKVYDSRYCDYKLNLCPISVEKTSEEIIEEIIEKKLDAVIVDYDFTSFAVTTNNGIVIANKIKEKFSEFPLFILTAFEDRLFQHETFDAYQVYNYDNYINNEDATKEFHSRIIEQILKSKKQIKRWEQELIELKRIPFERLNAELTAKIIDLDNKIEKSIDGHSSISPKTKQDLFSGGIQKLLEQADKLLEE